MKRLAVALADSASRGNEVASLDPLRRRLARAGAASTEAVVVDFLEDDLHQTEGALELVADYTARVETILRDGHTGRSELLTLAQSGVVEQVEELAETLAGMRRRLAQIAVHLPA